MAQPESHVCSQAFSLLVLQSRGEPRSETRLTELLLVGRIHGLLRLLRLFSPAIAVAGGFLTGLRHSCKTATRRITKWTGLYSSWTFSHTVGFSGACEAKC